MDTTLEALSHFRRLGFQQIVHHPSIAPTHNQCENKELEQLLTEAREADSFKEIAICEELLREKEEGKEEYVEATKTWELFKDFPSPYGDVPHLKGFYTSKECAYSLFFKIFPPLEKSPHLKIIYDHAFSRAGVVTLRNLELFESGELARNIQAYIENVKKKEIGIPQSVHFGSLPTMEIRPPYVLSTIGMDIDKAYSDIMIAVQKLGYPVH